MIFWFIIWLFLLGAKLIYPNKQIYLFSKVDSASHTQTQIFILRSQTYIDNYPHPWSILIHIDTLSYDGASTELSNKLLRAVWLQYGPRCNKLLKNHHYFVTVYYNQCFMLYLYSSLCSVFSSCIRCLGNLYYGRFSRHLSSKRSVYLRKSCSLSLDRLVSWSATVEGINRIA